VLVDADPGLRASVDPDRIHQVLANLLSNAMKYGDPAEPVEVSVRRLDEGRAQVRVANRGPGIPPDELGTLFARYARARDARAAGVPGLGLGLYICRGLVEAHGGSIRVESDPGATTAFHVVLPLLSPAR
jgi:signal transduction histidine kinase